MPDQMLTFNELLDLWRQEWKRQTIVETRYHNAEPLQNKNAMTLSGVSRMAPTRAAVVAVGADVLTDAGALSPVILRSHDYVGRDGRNE